MARNSIRSNHSGHSSNNTAFNGSNRGRSASRGTNSERTPLMQQLQPEEYDARSVRSGKSAWTDVTVHTQGEPSTTPNQVPRYREFDAQSIRSDRSTSTTRAQGTSSVAPNYVPQHVMTAHQNDNFDARSMMSERSSSSTVQAQDTASVARTQRTPSQPPHSLSSSNTTLVEPPRERIWSTQGGSGGQRTSVYYNRGILTRAGSREDQDRWPDALRAILYPCPINNMDLFEEALESPGSGVPFVGRTLRDTMKGNEPLAKVGESAMRLVLRDQCYLLKYSDDMTNRIVDQMLSRERLFDVGKNSKIETWIRPMKPIKPAKKNNVLALLKEDVRGVGNDRTRTIARAIKAIVGAIYYDQGFEWVQKAMFQWGLVIQMPGTGPR